MPIPQTNPTMAEPVLDLAEETASPAGPARSRRPFRAGRRLISPLVVLGLWQLSSTIGLVSKQKLPPPSKVASTAWDLWFHGTPAYGTLHGALMASLERMAIGFSIGAAAALILAIAAGLSRVGEDAIDPLMQMLRTLPLFGLVPVFILWFGIGQEPKLILIALGAAIPLYLNTFSGIRSVDHKLIELARALGLSRLETVRHVVLPGALPSILVGLRQSLGTAWLSLVVAEQLNTKSGLGFLINQATEFLRNDVIIVALLVYTILGLLTDWLVRLLERRALAWRREILG